MKKILIITQTVDRRDHILGFFHEWILGFSKKLDQVTVICLKKGEYDLPDNVKVLSLGKEDGSSRFKYSERLIRYSINERKNYDAVFVHMNQEYVIIAGLLWRVLGKRILFWRNHPQGNIGTRTAVFLSDKVYCTSPTSFTKRFSKTVLMPVGINVTEKKGSIVQKRLRILSLGRISPVKNVETVLSAFGKILSVVPTAKLSIVGDPMSRKIDLDYYENIRGLAGGLPVGSVSFYPGVDSSNTTSIYNSHEVFVNTTTPGSFDKTILESMAVGTPSFVCQDIWKETKYAHLAEHFYFPYKDSEALSRKIIAFFSLKKGDKERFINECREFVMAYHSLGSLVDRVISHI